MMYKQLSTIEDLLIYSYSTFEDELQEGYIIFLDSKNTLNIYETKDLKCLLSKIESGVTNIYFSDNQIFLNSEKVIFKFNLNKKILEPFYNLDYNSNSVVISNDLILFTKEKIVDFEIIESDKRILSINSNTDLFQWNDLNNFIQLEGDFIYLQSFKSDNIIRRNVLTKAEDYSLELDNGSFGQRILGQTEDVFFLQRAVSKPNLFNVLALEKSTGKIIWETENTHPYYCFDEVNNKLYGLGDKRFEVINTLTGEKELVTELDVNVFISSHLTFYSDGFLYFSSHLDNNIPVFGAVNVKSGKLEFIQEVKIEGEKSFRIGLEKPIVVDNKLYVKDSLNTLHIFEKETTPTAV